MLGSRERKGLIGRLPPAVEGREPGASDTADAVGEGACDATDEAAGGGGGGGVYGGTETGVCFRSAGATGGTEGVRAGGIGRDGSTAGHGARGVTGCAGIGEAARGGVRGAAGVERTGLAGVMRLGGADGVARDDCAGVERLRSIPTGITPPQLEQRARTPPRGTFAGSTR
jgi:hypothetical protein